MLAVPWQLKAITEVARATAARSRRCAMLGTAGLAVGLVACAIALLR
jgi:hypothetical protein